MHARRLGLGAALAALVFALAPPASAQRQKPDLEEQVQAALNDGVRWLTAAQNDDGSWSYANEPFTLEEYPMAQGVTALCAYALLKCGVPPDEPVIERAFEFIYDQPIQYTYSVGCVLLAIEAKAGFEVHQARREGTSTRRDRIRARGKDKRLAKACVRFLLAHQTEGGLWRYPHGQTEDISHAQYALLGLDAASRLGIDVDEDVWRRAALRLIECQEEQGRADVEPFPVPGADLTFEELKEIEEELEEELTRVRRDFDDDDPEATDDEGRTREDATRTAERRASSQLHEATQTRAREREDPGMQARGWTYGTPSFYGTQAWQRRVTGSMTTSAVASLFVCKAHLEGDRVYERRIKDDLDRALRDGAAWIALCFTVTENPGASLHQFYYLYGLERAGVLGLIPRFGEHEWYSEGARYLVRQQRDGQWWSPRHTTAGPVPDTAFGLLFLARGTEPVIRLPERVMTGDY